MKRSRNLKEARLELIDHLQKYHSATITKDAEILNENKKIVIQIFKLTGLINSSNTCYLNSIIQAMFSCKKFVKSLIQETNQATEINFPYLIEIKTLFLTMLITGVKKAYFKENK